MKLTTPSLYILLSAMSACSSQATTTTFSENAEDISREQSEEDSGATQAPEQAGTNNEEGQEEALGFASMTDGGAGASSVESPEIPVSLGPNITRSCSRSTDSIGVERADCLDPRCHQILGCEYGQELSCDDDYDNDGDGSSDCADADCRGQGVCEFSQELSCSDQADNDGD
ncbi:MAG: hypothetical protein MK135_01165 [Polyangiaceae bacterium]|nr:hypothetical protein [Polyangiaceae bacterium]